MGGSEVTLRTVGEVLARLAEIDAERIALMSQLRDGLRSRGLVGEYGELIATAV